AKARGIADLPDQVNDLLKELDTQAKRHGGLHVASGTLGAGVSGSVRLALLRVIFLSVGLPEHYHIAKFAMWLIEENIYDEVKKIVEKSGGNWKEELDNFYVAEDLHKALVKIKPTLFRDKNSCSEVLTNQYPFVSDVSSSDMLNTIKQVLSKDGKLPLTLIVLDEVQQFIGEDGDRSLVVQETVEAVCKGIGGKLMFIGTGQTAVTGTANLKRLEGRFTLRIELSDSDVESVIRKVVLAKNAGCIKDIETIMEKNLGEISRHLSNTTISHRQDDIINFPKDYPILPVRRRFWENTLRVLDQTGTDSQLRNQLSMIHKVIQTNLDEDLGNVIAGDYIYFDSADKLLQARILPRRLYEKTMTWIKGNDTEKLLARACGVIFIINKLNSINKEIGIKATVDTIADLLVEDLSEGSGKLRGKLPKLLDSCELLMNVKGEYRIQTEESSAWNDEYLSQKNTLANEPHRIESVRDDRLKSKFGELIKKVTLSHGKSKVPRSVFTSFNTHLPSDSKEKIYAWVKDGWNIDENSVRAEAQAAGNNSPTIFVYLPKRSGDALRHNIMEYKAAKSTIEAKGTPNGPEGQEAKAAMDTTLTGADSKIKDLLDEIFSGAMVFQGGGKEIQGSSLLDKIKEAAENSLQRLYPDFHYADNTNWDKVYTDAKKGSPDALKAVGFDSEAEKHPVCKEILSYIGSTKKGAEILTNFQGGKYGWSGDTIDGALLVLLVAGVLRAQDERGRQVEPQQLERRQISKTTFKVESTTVSTKQRIEIRKLFPKVDIPATSGEEGAQADAFLEKLKSLASEAGGEPPLPVKPDLSKINEIELLIGNEKLMAIYNNRDELSENITDWKATSEKIEKRMPGWESLQVLLGHASNLKPGQEAKIQVQAITDNRRLLDDPDPIKQLAKTLEDTLRKSLNHHFDEYNKVYKEGIKKLEKDSSWTKLGETTRDEILDTCRIKPLPEIDLSNRDAVIATVDNYPLNSWHDKIIAIQSMFEKALELAAKELEPKLQKIAVSKRILKTPGDLDAWLAEVKKQLEEALKDGPVSIS
ncbi:BREX system P-loop protein BrxC, partial [Bacteroidota bacterium]